MNLGTNDFGLEVNIRFVKRRLPSAEKLADEIISMFPVMKSKSDLHKMQDDYYKRKAYSQNQRKQRVVSRIITADLTV